MKEKHMDKTPIEQAKEQFLDAQKRFVDTEQTLHTAHDAFMTSCEELKVAEKNLNELQLMDNHPPLKAHAP